MVRGKWYKDIVTILCEMIAPWTGIVTSKKREREGERCGKPEAIFRR